MNLPSTKHAIIVIFSSLVSLLLINLREKKREYLCHHRPSVRARAHHRHKTEDEIKNSNAFFLLILLVRTAEWKIVYLTIACDHNTEWQTQVGKIKNMEDRKISVANAKATQLLWCYLRRHTGLRISPISFLPFEICTEMDEPPAAAHRAVNLFWRHNSTENGCVQKIIRAGERAREIPPAKRRGRRIKTKRFQMPYVLQ